SVVFYSALVKVVELYVDGRLFQGDASTLGNGGWSYRMSDEESIRAVANAAVVASQCERVPVQRAAPASELFDSPDAEEAFCLIDGGERNRSLRRRLGLTTKTIQERIVEDEQVFAIVDPAEMVKKAREELDKKAKQPKTSTLTAVQKEKLRRKEATPDQRNPLPKPDVLDPQFAQGVRTAQSMYGPKSEERKKAEQAWMTKLKNGDYSGPVLDSTRYLTLRNQTIEENVRQTEGYRTLCTEAVGVGEIPDMERYAHLKPEDFDVIRWCVRRGSGSMWLPDSPRTTVKGFRHRLITRGPPVRRPLFRLNRPDTEWVEKAIAEDVKRGQLEKGTSDWGFPAFPTKEAKAYKAIKRGRRLVVDYRELNKVTVRKFFLIPNSDYIKSTVAGNRFISVGDLKEGFNQVDNEEETRKKIAVLSATGCWLPRGLTFGPTNGPEDFQELVFTVFSRRLYRDWYLFVDDLSVATGRKPCH
ncbi:MAG: hypothetical protein QF745_03810, partial [Planctomycetota bacterium]|nr:hypothetical protein [Planctomycetota bacterium]